MKEVLLGINLQLDFFPGGALDLKDNLSLIETANRLSEHFQESYLVYDWHPADHLSFAGNYLWRYPGQVLEQEDGNLQLWLIHAVAESFGAELHPKIIKTQWSMEFYKGEDPKSEEFSGLSAKTKPEQISLLEVLKENKIEKVNLIGMCTEFDILHSALAARAAGLEVAVYQDACFPAAFEEGTQEKALLLMEEKGVIIINS